MPKENSKTKKKPRASALIKNNKEYAKNYPPGFKAEVLLSLKEQFNGNIKQCASEFGIEYNTLKAWTQQQDVINKSAEQLHLMKYNLVDINRQLIHHHNGEIIKKAASLEHKIIEKLEALLATVSTPSEMKQVTELWNTLTNRFTAIQGKDQAPEGGTVVNNTQNNFFGSVNEAMKSEGVLKLKE